MTHAPVLDIQDLRIDHRRGRSRLNLVEGVSFSIGRGEIVGLVGESGSGKSLTALSIMRLLPPRIEMAGGAVRHLGRDLAPLDESEMRRLRGNRLAMVFQDPMTTLNPVLRIGTQFEETMLAHGSFSRRERLERAVEALVSVRIDNPRERLMAYPHELSGGMRQRIAIAIAQLHHPDLLIADEPTTALDASVQSRIVHDVSAMARTNHMSVLWITHDLHLVRSLADRVIVMYAGRIVESGSTASLFSAPLHPYTRGLLRSMPSGERGSRLFSIPGNLPEADRRPTGCTFRTRCDHAVTACEHEPALLERQADRLVRCVLE